MQLDSYLNTIKNSTVSCAYPVLRLWLSRSGESWSKRVQFFFLSRDNRNFFQTFLFFFLSQPTPAINRKRCFFSSLKEKAWRELRVDERYSTKKKKRILRKEKKTCHINHFIDCNEIRLHNRTPRHQRKVETFYLESRLYYLFNQPFAPLKRLLTTKPTVSLFFFSKFFSIILFDFILFHIRKYKYFHTFARGKHTDGWLW